MILLTFRRSAASGQKRRNERGLSLVEVVSAMAVMSLASLGVTTSLLTTAGVDEALRERTTALRAATSQMEAIMAFDYGNDLNNLATHIRLPATQAFDIEGLDSPKRSTLTAEALVLNPVGQPAKQGFISVDTTDPFKLEITVNVDWTSRSGETRRLRLPMTIAAVDSQ